MDAKKIGSFIAEKRKAKKKAEGALSGFAAQHRNIGLCGQQHFNGLRHDKGPVRPAEQHPVIVLGKAHNGLLCTFQRVAGASDEENTGGVELLFKLFCGLVHRKVESGDTGLLN